MLNFFKFAIIISLISIILFGCNSNDDEIKKLQEENEKLKTEMLEKERIEKEAEKEKLTQEVDSLKSVLAQKKAFADENNRLKDLTLELTVDKLKPDGRKWDLTGGPDIIGELTINNKSFSISGIKDDYKVTLNIRQVVLRQGDIVNLVIYDKDMSQHDLICKGEIKYDGEKSISKKMGSAEIEIKIE